MTRPPAPDPDDLRALLPDVQHALRGLADELGAARAELTRMRARLAQIEALADRDPLTGLLNRRGFGRELRRAAAEAGRHGVSSAVAYFDLDGFKAVNDRLGHAAGDAALVQVARLLQGNVRETDAVARLGGDEFAVLLSYTELAAAKEKAERLERLIAQTPLAHGGHVLTLGTSAGVRALTAGMAPEAALAEADRAMFAVKRARKLRAVT